MAFLKMYGDGVCSTNGKIKGRRSSTLLVPKRLPRRSRTEQQLQRKRTMEKMERSMKKLKKEMEEIGEEQKQKREGQRQVREKFEAMEEECKQLRFEDLKSSKFSSSNKIVVLPSLEDLKHEGEPKLGVLALRCYLPSFLSELLAFFFRCLKLGHDHLCERGSG